MKLQNYGDAMSHDTNNRVDEEAPDNRDYPKNDNGENWIFFVCALPFRFVIGMVSAKTVDRDAAKRGVFDGEENPEAIGEIIGEYRNKFFHRR